MGFLSTERRDVGRNEGWDFRFVSVGMGFGAPKWERWGKLNPAAYVQFSEARGIKGGHQLSMGSRELPPLMLNQGITLFRECIGDYNKSSPS